MGTKTVSLDEEAYEHLKARKRDDESFSQVVKRLAGERSWQEVAGILADEEADALVETIESGRVQSRQRSDRLADELSESTSDVE